MKNTKKPIVISLKDSSNTKAFTTKNLIYCKEFDKTTGWIDESLKKIDEQLRYFSEHKSFMVRHQDTISILGSRGSGKSSFLMSLLEKYRPDQEVEVISIIDPTLIEDKGHIFLTIIAKIKELVEVKFNNNVCNPQSSENQRKNIWREKLRTLSHGLPYTDGLNRIDDTSWQDPEYIMDRGLRSVSAASNLEYNFHDFVKYSLEILGKKLFLLALDDIDVDFKKGWPVLEILRKYLTTPQIISIISGDIDLFSKAIRKQQWSNFGKALLKNEADTLHNTVAYNDLVTEMEGQYLQKVMKPERRIHLRTLLEKIEIYQSEILVEGELSSADDGYLEIKEYYAALLSKFGINSSSESAAYTTFLLNLPLRTQIQFLSIFEDGTNKLDDRIKQVELADTFLSDMYEKHIDVDLAKNQPKMLNVVILKLLLNEEMLSQAYQLQPTTSDVSLNGGLTALSLLFSQKVRNNPFLIFDYFIKIGYVKNLFNSLEYQSNDKTSSNNAPSIEGLCKHAQIYQDKVLRDVVGNMTSYIRGLIETKNSSHKPFAGTLLLAGLASRSGESKKDKSGRIDFVLNGSSSILVQILGYIPLSIGEPNYRSRLYPYYSIFTLFATIGELLKCDTDNELFNQRLLEMSQVRSYPIPNFRQEDGSDGEEALVTTIVDKEDDEKKDFISAMLNWKKMYNDHNIVVSPHVLGKISTRFYSAIRAIDRYREFYEGSLGDAMHRIIIAFFNSIFIEDLRENHQKKILRIISNNNPNMKDDLFINNLKNTEEDLQRTKDENPNLYEIALGSIAFSKWVLSCPLLLAYLNLDEKLKTGLKSYVYNPDLVDENKSVYKHLKLVSLMDPVEVSKDSKTETSFITAKNKMPELISILKKNNISYDFYMNKNIEDVLQSCRSIFTQIGERSISITRELIKMQNLSW